MTFTEDEIERYARHLVLSDVGGPGQQRLKAANVLLVGAGGVGGPAALYLAAAGVGRVALVDPDDVSLSNLQRQIQFTTADIGRPKVQAAGLGLAALNPHVEIELAPWPVDARTVDDLIAGRTVVIDGCDDFHTRLLVSDACVKAGVPLISGALGRWDGQVGVFAGRPCYRCLVSEVPPDAETCARVGVVGALAGVVGSMAALEAIKLIAGAGEPLTGRLWRYDGLKGESRTVRIAADPTCRACGAPQANAARSVST